MSQAGSVPRRSAPFRVLELASPATAACGRLLAEAGCDVVKVEPPGGAPERRWPPLIGPVGAAQSAFSLYHDAGKRAITLDLEAAGGREELLALVEDADVLLEGLAPGTLAAQGLGYQALAARNAGLVLVSVTAFGQDGPYSQYAANDLTVFAMGGLMFISGQPGEPPVVAPDQQAWTVAGTHGALATLAALWGREQTGRGDWVDVSAFECLAAQENTLTNYRGPGEFTRRNGSQHRSALPGCILPCQDGYLHLFINQSPPMWERFVAWVGHPPELADPALANVTVRWEHEAVVMEVTRRFVGARTVAELYTSAQAHHLPCVPVYSPAEFLADPQTVAREIVVEASHPELGRVRTLRPPLALGAVPTGVGTARLAPQCWGEQMGVGEGNVAPPALGSAPSAPQLWGEMDGGAGRTRRERGGRDGEDSPVGRRAFVAGGAEMGGRGPLSGVRVCAFTHVAAGPYATLQLAYLGAEVIKVESTTRIDSWRYRDRNNDPERSRPFADHNKNVRSVLLDLKTAEGVELARRLIATCDATIDNMSVGVLDRLGLGFEDLRRVRSDIIVLHMAGLGATGPRHEYVTFGPSVMSLCGMTYLWNLPEWPVPVGSQSSYPDYLVGVYAAYAIAAALHRRARTGDALLMDLAQVEAMACALGPSFVATLNGAEAAVRPVGNAPPQPPTPGGSTDVGSTAGGSASWGWAPYGCYPCRSEAAGCTDDDAWCAIAVETDAQWAGLRVAMGCPPWAEHAALATAAGRVAWGARLDARVAEWTRQHTPRDVMERCQAQGVPAGLVATGEDLAHDPHLAARGFLLDMEHPRMGRLPMPGCPVRFTRQPVEVWRYGPLLGEDNDYVLGEILGLAAGEVATYVERRVVR